MNLVQFLSTVFLEKQFYSGKFIKQVNASSLRNWKLGNILDPIGAALNVDLEDIIAVFTYRKNHILIMTLIIQ